MLDEKSGIVVGGEQEWEVVEGERGQEWKVVEGKRGQEWEVVGGERG